MIKPFILGVIFLLPTLNFSQDLTFNFAPKGKKKDKGKSETSLPYRYRSLSLKFGPRALNAEPGTIVASFTDDSPSGDNFTTTTTVKEKYNRFGFQLAYEWRKYKGLNHSLFLDFATGSGLTGGILGYSIGWNIPLNNKLIIRPAAFLAVGSNNFDLGDLENNSIYIQIGDNIYYDRLLNVGLEGQLTSYGPQLDLRYILSEKIHLLFNFNYDVSSQNGSPKMVFNPPATSDNSTSSSKSIDTDNPFLSYNGNKLEKMPYDLGGIRLSLGFGYVWPRN